MRVLIAGLIGGIVMFAWGAVAHTVLPLGEMGMKFAAGQDAVISALQSGVEQQGEGVYMMPGMPQEQWQDEAAMQSFREKYASSPYAFVIYQPGGNPAVADMTPNLIKQFVSDTIAALLAAWVLSLGAWGFGRRVLIAVGMGLFAWLNVSVPYWNWYLFPTDFTLGSLIEQAVGWLLAGSAIAWWLGRKGR
ncbi:hypothetical protein [Vulcaniibacterium gelatinicum]|uniref:hypothetical protein n=1 Tax=Vulcaniibacterium gelatinicum TaxID=2598725 RepID=UPI0011CAA80D|nr:hypothetical protein [Vulcaniibacterium gelatinicum]